MAMRITAGLLMTIALAVSTGSQDPALRVYAASASQAASAQNQPQPFRAGVDLVRTDAIVRDARGQFIADLKAEEFEVYEDGVKQELVSLTMIHGGREYNVLSPPAPRRDGLILPANRPRSDTAGRIFVIIVDDFHLEAGLTPKTRQILGQMLRDLIHDGDMFGIVSTGYSSISEQLTYDRQVLESAIRRTQGGGLSPREIIQGAQGSQGPTSFVIARTWRSRWPTNRCGISRRCRTGARRSSTSAAATTSIRSRSRVSRSKRCGLESMRRTCRTIRSSVRSRAVRCWQKQTW